MREKLVTGILCIFALLGPLAIGLCLKEQSLEVVVGQLGLTGGEP